MRVSKWRMRVGVVAIVLACASGLEGQWQAKPYTEWSEVEVKGVLDNSPWGQTQTFTDTSQMFDTGRRLDSGVSRVADVFEVNFRIRFISAKPIRQAISRSIELQQKGGVAPQLAAQLRAFATGEFPDYIVVTVLCDAEKPTNYLHQANSLPHKLTTVQLKDRTYLLTKGGKRVFLKEYQSPRTDGLGARFVFPRFVDQRPFLAEESGQVQFYSELSDAFKLNMRFNVSEMVFQGKLEY